MARKHGPTTLGPSKCGVSGLLVWGLLVACAAGCTSVGPSERIAPLRIAVLSPQDDRSTPPSGDQGLFFDVLAEDFQGTLIEDLRALNAATEVFAADDVEQAREGGADTCLVPVLKGGSITHEGWGDHWWASLGLWLVSWIGGLAVDDSSYKTDLVVDCQFTDPRGRAFHTMEASIDRVEVNFLERNSLLSLSGLQSLVLPPFLTTDVEESTREVLTSRLTAEVAGRIGRFLDADFEKQALAYGEGSIDVVKPENGAVVSGTTVPMEVQVERRGEIVSVGVKVAEQDPQVMISPEQEVDGLGVHRARLTFELRGLRPGLNTIVISATGDQEFTRTLRLRWDGPASD